MQPEALREALFGVLAKSLLFVVHGEILSALDWVSRNKGFLTVPTLIDALKKKNPKKIQISHEKFQKNFL